MKRYLIFATFNHDASGGLNGAIEDLDELQAAIDYANSDSASIYDECYVWDRITGETVYRPEHTKVVQQINGLIGHVATLAYLTPYNAEPQSTFYPVMKFHVE